MCCCRAVAGAFRRGLISCIEHMRGEHFRTLLCSTIYIDLDLDVDIQTTIQI